MMGARMSPPAPLFLLFLVGASLGCEAKRAPEPNAAGVAPGPASVSAPASAAAIMPEAAKPRELALEGEGGLVAAQLTDAGHAWLATRSTLVDWDLSGQSSTVRARIQAASDPTRAELVWLDPTGAARTVDSSSFRFGEATERALAVSADGSRFVYVGSPRSLDGAGTLEECSACIFSMRDGKRVQCTKVPPLVLQGMVGGATLSPTGAFLVYEVPLSDAIVLDASSGKRLLGFSFSAQGNRMGAHHWLFASDRRLITFDGKSLRAMDLPSPAVVASASYPGYRYEWGHAPSPDAQYIATALSKGSDWAVGLWDLSRAAPKIVSLPAGACDATCDLVWRTPTLLVVVGKNRSVQIDAPSAALQPAAQHADEPSALLMDQRGAWTLRWGADLVASGPNGARYTMRVSVP